MTFEEITAYLKTSLPIQPTRIHLKDGSILTMIISEKEQVKEITDHNRWIFTSIEDSNACVLIKGDGIEKLEQINEDHLKWGIISN